MEPLIKLRLSLSAEECNPASKHFYFVFIFVYHLSFLCICLCFVNTIFGSVTWTGSRKSGSLQEVRLILDLVVLLFLNADFVVKAGFCLVFLVESKFALACYHEHQVIAFICSKYWGLCAASGFTD